MSVSITPYSYAEHTLCSAYRVLAARAAHVLHVRAVWPHHTYAYIHFCHILCSQDMRAPIYFNMVRDPVARLTSYFYYTHEQSTHHQAAAKRLAAAMGAPSYSPNNHTLSVCLAQPRCYEYVKETGAEIFMRQVH